MIYVVVCEICTLLPLPIVIGGIDTVANDGLYV